jgi:SAM-dependent methyltransferase
MTEHAICPVCGAPEIEVFFTLSETPVLIGDLWPTKETARNCAKGPIELGFCQHCGFIWNLAFDPSRLEYSQAYDNSLHFSPCYSEYAQSTASQLIDRYDLHHKRIVEIGCGKGDFLILLCQQGDNSGTGFDPSYEAREIEPDIAERVTFVQAMYSEQYADIHSDFLCSRYVFEHIQKPAEFLRMIRRSLGDRSETIVYFEVPNVYLILRNLSVWDIIYEHCSYFSPGSLAYVFEACDFTVLNIAETFSKQFIGIEAAPEPHTSSSSFNRAADLENLTQDVAAFVQKLDQTMQMWQQRLESFKAQKQRVVIWGAGAKGVGFLSMLQVYEQIVYAVDINPHKHGRFLAGTGQEIVPPGFLREYQPDVVIVMNPVYQQEIEESITAMGITPEILTM